MDADRLISQIEKAWANVPHPGDDLIFTKDSYDDEDIVKYFSGTTWRGHKASELRAHSSAFTFFTSQAFHYWLPAFLISAIQSPSEADVILDAITRCVNDDYGTYRWPLFSREQLLALAAYFEFQLERSWGSEDEREALAILKRRL